MLFLLILIIAGASWIIDNILWIILVAVIINVILPLLFYWKPKLCIAIAAVLLIIGLGVGLISAVTDQINTNNREITLYRATDTCAFYDETYEIRKIPEGAIFVVFGHHEQKSQEPGFIGSRTLCYWYYEGTVYNSTVSNKAQIYKWDGVNWNREEIGVTTYKEIMYGDWWKNQ